GRRAGRGSGGGGGRPGRAAVHQRDHRRAQGVQVQIYTCSGNANQTITRTTAGELRVSGKCLAANADGTTAGTQVILWACNGKTSQQWAFRVDGTVVNRSDGLVLDVTNAGTANGSKVQLWTGLGNTNQVWSRA
ncbi:ricin-type beta-trefoil lectin domain protein, partial [Streptomyces sp. NPDC005921]